MMNGPRPLVWPLTYSAAISAIVPAAHGTSNLPAWPDNEQRIIVSWCLSLPEFVRLASAIDVGSDIAYAEDALAVWSIWSENLVCVCLQLESCLLDASPSLLAALSAAMNAAGAGVPGQAVSAGQLAQDLLALPSCNRDELWGACLYVTRRINRLITDIFEVIELASDTIEASQALLNAIPFIGGAISYAAALADQVTETLADAYRAAYSEEVELFLACALFCACRDDCVVSLDRMIATYNQLLSSPLDVDVNTVPDFLDGFTTSSWVGEEVCYAAFTLAAYAIGAGQQFGPLVGSRSLANSLALGANQPSDAWQLICDCDDTWVVERLGGDGNANIQQGTGLSDNNAAWTYSEANDWLVANPRPSPTPQYRIGVAQMAASAPFIVTRVRAVVEIQNPQGRGQSIAVAAGLPAWPGDILAVINPGATGEYEIDTGEIYEEVGAIAFRWTAGSPSGYALLKKIVIYGVGPEPDWL